MKNIVRFAGVLTVSTLLLACNQASAESFNGKWKLTTLQDGRPASKNTQSVMTIQCSGNDCQVETVTKSIMFDNEPVKKVTNWTLSKDNTLTKDGILVMSIKNGKLILDNYTYEKLTE